jgi:hypothetical protein
MGYQAPQMEIVCKIWPREVDVSTTPIGPTNLLAFHISGLGFWMFRVFLFIIYVKNDPLEPHCNQLLANERSRHISLFRDKLPPF